MHLYPQNILVIDFGQLGDVILSLPALDAVRKKFPSAKITVLAGKAPSEIIELCGVADYIVPVDRVALRDGPKFSSIGQIFRLAREIRRGKFDLVIDLHSLPETNILGFVSGAKYRLYANRESRSIDFLSNFRPKPPLEEKQKHLTYNYMRVVEPLGIQNARSFVKISPSTSDLQGIDHYLKSTERKELIGLYLGAGHSSRRWSLANFVALAHVLLSNEDYKIVVLLGPEEKALRAEVKRKFPAEAIILDELKLKPLAALMTRLQILISNDTGPMHLGAAVGTPIVLILDDRSPDKYLPLNEKLRIVRSGKIDEIKVEEVYDAALDLLGGNSA